MENQMRIYASSIAQRFLLTQLYMQMFHNDPLAREHMPPALIGVTQQDANSAANTDALTAELMRLVHEEVQQFFTDVEARLDGMHPHV